MEKLEVRTAISAQCNSIIKSPLSICDSFQPAPIFKPIMLLALTWSSWFWSLEFHAIWKICSWRWSFISILKLFDITVHAWTPSIRNIFITGSIIVSGYGQVISIKVTQPKNSEFAGFSFIFFQLVTASLILNEFNFDKKVIILLKKNILS